MRSETSQGFSFQTAVRKIKCQIPEKNPTKFPVLEHFLPKYEQKYIIFNKYTLLFLR